jgi:hypothetical protein
LRPVLRRFSVVAALTLPLLSLACGEKAAGPSQPNAHVAQFLGDQAVRVLSAPTTVQTFRLVSRAESAGAGATATSVPSSRGPATLHGWPVAAAGADRDAAFGSRIAGALFDPSSYRFDRAKGCIFDPGVGFRVWRGDEYVDLLLCFSCDEFRLVLPKASGKAGGVGEDFEDNRAAFVALARQAFPQDPLIQALR